MLVSRQYCQQCTLSGGFHDLLSLFLMAMITNIMASRDAAPCGVVWQIKEAALSSESLVRVWHNSRRHVPENHNILMYKYHFLVRSRLRRLFGVTEVSL
jgi:hypothetical protein